MYHRAAMPPSDSGPSGPIRHRSSLLRVGEKLGRYTVEGVVGEGGMGIVYRARDAKLGRKVALKVIAAADDDPDSVERVKRFVREARSAAALDHPNAVSIFDVGEEGDIAFIAMELVTGRSLREHIKAGNADMDQRLRWLLEIAGALAAAHKARLIHRDIKPENVMIREDGRAKVLDFGLARRTAKPPEEVTGQTAITLTEDGQTTLTAVGTLMGTPQYMAPEQIRSEPLDGRSDEFSWGVLAYELLTGALPWTGMGIHVMARILSDRPAPIREVNPEVPEDAAAVVMRALARMPEDRFQSMDEVITALDVFAAPASSSARSTTPRPQLLAPSQRPHRAPAAGAPAAGGAAPQNVTQRSADPGFPAAPQPKARKPPEVAVREPGSGPPPAEEEPLRARGLIFAVAAIALAAGSFVAWRGAHAKSGATTSATSAAAIAGAAPTATAITELPAPRSPSPEAVAAYRAGLQELRFGGTRDPFEKATALDPALAAAHLQFAVDATEVDFTDLARVHLRKAGELRASLSERDQALLDAVEPVLLRQPADWAEASRRLGAAVERFPGDAQLWYERGSFSQAAEGLEASTRYLETAVTLDPRYAAAIAQQAENLVYLGRLAEARAALARCTAMAPTYLTCHIELVRLLEHEGACEEEETMARQLVAASPQQGVSQGMLAAALAARGKPETAVREALRLKWAALPDADRRGVEPQDTLALALLSGDFTAAEQLARALAASAEPSRREADHGRAARQLAHIYAEMGRPADVARVAEAYLGRRDAWEPDPRSEDFAMAGDATPSLLAAALHVGKLPRTDFVPRRDEWVRGWERKAPRDFRRYVWAHGFAETVETADDAREALAAMAAYEPVPVFYPKTLAEAAVGLTYLLAGRAGDALPWLERAAKTCRVLELPVEHTRAHLWLGMAREAQGDKAGACAAYKVVRDRWGKAKPRSVTWEKAAERMRAAGCGG
jgi:serine/threonine-protein kinase